MTYHLFSLNVTRARTNHRCIWCGEKVNAGEDYLRERSVYDGSFQNFAWHPECREDAEDGWANGDDAEFTAFSAERPARERAFAAC